MGIENHHPASMERDERGSVPQCFLARVVFKANDKLKLCYFTGHPALDASLSWQHPTYRSSRLAANHRD